MKLRRAFVPREIKVVLVDGAGTVFDPGSKMPGDAFEKAFTNFGLQVPRPLIDRHMGKEKMAHVMAILVEPEVKASFRKEFRGEPGDGHAQIIYGYLKTNLLLEAEKMAVIPGVFDAVSKLRKMGIKIVMTTGYDRETTEKIFTKFPHLAQILSDSVTSSEVTQGRPAPFMLYRGMELSSTYSIEEALNVGDTETDLRTSDNTCMAGILVTSGITSLTDGLEINRKLGRAHLILPSLVEIAEYILDGTIYERIKTAEIENGFRACFV